MAKIHVLPNIITAFGLTCGLFVIFKMNMTEPGEANLHILTASAGFLLLAAFLDFVDGAIARVMKAESEFGGLFDSLADAITFGVAPSVIVLKSLSMSSGTLFSFLITAAAMIFSVCGVLRLVRFNVMASQSKNDPHLVAAGKKNFTGLPIPAAATAVVSANLLLVSEEFNTLFAISDLQRMWILFTVLVVLGYFMISRWKFPSVKSFQIRVASFQIVLVTVILAVIIFYGILNHFPVVFFALSWSYLLVAWLLSLARLIAGKRAKALEDFEPEPDDLEEEGKEN